VNEGDFGILNGEIFWKEPPVLKKAGYRVSGSRFQVTGFKLQVGWYRFYKFQVPGYRLRGFENWEFGK
jgi:hypothetical protein